MFLHFRLKKTVICKSLLIAGCALISIIQKNFVKSVLITGFALSAHIRTHRTVCNMSAELMHKAPEPVLLLWLPYTFLSAEYKNNILRSYKPEPRASGLLYGFIAHRLCKLPAEQGVFSACRFQSGFQLSGHFPRAY